MKVWVATVYDHQNERFLVEVGSTKVEAEDRMNAVLKQEFEDYKDEGNYESFEEMLREFAFGDNDPLGKVVAVEREF